MSTSNDDELHERHKEVLSALEGIKQAVTPAKPVTELTRPEWDALGPGQQAAFIGRGGVIRDLTPEEKGQRQNVEREQTRQAAVSAGRSVMLRADWNKLTPAAQGAFMAARGVVVD